MTETNFCTESLRAAMTIRWHDFLSGPRERLCTYAEEVELPSGAIGVGYVDCDDRRAWRNELANELECAGIDVDWNMVLRG